MSVRRRGAADPETICVRRVINCTGPARDVTLGSSSLLRSLIARGIGRPGPLALGLDVSDSGALVGKDGRDQNQIYAVGPLLKERLWETTAVRELRVQTLELAAPTHRESITDLIDVVAEREFEKTKAAYSLSMSMRPG